jgi:hypothetical protein
MEIENFIKKAQGDDIDSNQFIAISNICEEKLQSLLDLELDGIPCPSVQIKPFPNTLKGLEDIKDKNSLHGFGEISIIFNKKNLFGNHNTIPRNDATHNIYAGDAYTLRFPDIVHSQHIKDRNNLIKELREISYKENCIYSETFEVYMEKKDKGLVMSIAKESFTFKLLYLERNGLLDDFKIKRKKVYDVTVDKISDEFRDFVKNFDFDEACDNPNTYFVDELEKRIESKPAAFTRRRLREEYTDENGKLSSLNFFLYHEKEIEALKGNIKSKTIIDDEKTSASLARLIKKAEKSYELNFKEFIETEINAIYHSPRIKDTGAEVTIDSVVDYMKKHRGQGAEQGGGSGAFNREVAKSVRQIRSYEDLIENLDILTNDDREVKCYIEMFSKLAKHYDGEMSPSDYDRLYDIELPKIMSTIGYAINTGRIKEELLKINIVNAPDELLIEFKDFINETNNKKQYYYEAKPNKAFTFKHSGWDDGRNIEGIVVPNNISKKILDYLENKTDLKIVKYNSNKKISRLKALYQFRANFIKDIKKPKQSKKIKI